MTTTGIIDTTALPPGEKLRGYLALVGLAFSYALFGVFTRVLAKDFALFQQVYLRIGVALLIGTLIYRRELGAITLSTLPRRDLWLFILRAIVTYPLGVAPYIYAVTQTSLANVAFIGALPVSAVWGVILFGEKLTPLRLTFIGTALAGVLLIVAKDMTDLSTWGLPELCALVATLFFLLGATLVKKQSPQLPNSVLTQYFLSTGFVICFACSVAAGEQLGFIPTWANMATTLIAGSLITLNVLLANYGFKRIPAMVGGNLMTSELVFILILGYLIYGEVPTLRATIGGGIIAASVILLTYFESRLKRSE